MSADGPAFMPTIETIVLLGSFNPLILDLNWLLKHQVISEFELQQVQESGKAVVSRQLVLMELRTFRLQVDESRVQISMTPEAETPLLLGDAVVKIFGVLSHTPVTAVGLNHAVHREVEESRVEQILDLLAPHERVEALLPNIRLEDLTWQADRDDDYAGRLLVSVQPSHALQGLYLTVNDHFDLGDSGTGQSAAVIVAEEWQRSLQRADEVFDKVLHL